MIEPAQKEDVFLEDVRRAGEEPDRLHIWWLGQSGFLAKWNRLHVLFDPYLSDSLTRKYAATDKPHIRMTGRVVAPEQLDFIDVVASSHTHTDHLDPETLQPLVRVNPEMTLVFPEANRGTVNERLAGLGSRLAGLDGEETITAAGLEISGIPAAHNEVERDGEGRCRFLGFVAKMGPWTLYHSGDTLLHPGLVPALGRFSIDVAFLPINGNQPERRVAGNLNGREAAELARQIGAGLVIPCHYEMFTFNTESPELFENTCREIGQPFRTLRAGERLSFGKP
jgi:L-ascorbate metabolism protein UlaG (beta-lactamase superfamily)